MKQEKNDNPVNLGRREFFRSAVRYSIGGTLLAGVGSLLLRKRSADAKVQECPANLPCKRCGSFDACELPAAQITRKSSIG